MFCSLNGLIDKLNGVFGKDKFDYELRSALKRHSFSVSERNGSVYEITDGSTSLKIDTDNARKAYEACRSEEKLEEFTASLEKRCDMESRMVSFTNGQAFLRFVVLRENDVEKNMISSDFITGMKKVMVYTADDMELFYLEERVMKQWAVPKEVLFSVADRNMCRLLSKAEVKQSEIGDGVNAMEFELPSKQLAVSLMMCNDFRKAVYKHMGSKFLVIAPSRENLLILGDITNNILEGLGKVIIKEYKESKVPLTTDVMLFTPDNIRIAGRFAIKGESEPSEVGRKL